MTIQVLRTSGRRHDRRLVAAIFDVDGVILASPHERAWREALRGLTDPSLLTTAIYQASVAGKPRLSGAQAALEAIGVPNAQRQAEFYADRKQEILRKIVHAEGVITFPDALRFIMQLAGLGWKMAVASSSKNATAMLKQVRLSTGQGVLDVFDVNVCGRDLARGKPDPEIFLLAAEELRVAPTECFVIEDAPAGVKAAHAGGMRSIGVARSGDAASLRQAGADDVVVSLDEVVMNDAFDGQLSRRPA